MEQYTKYTIVGFLEKNINFLVERPPPPPTHFTQGPNFYFVANNAMQFGDLLEF